jgi:NAD(P)-dependent dehydrogenase (short-subunit alcohol dehydrogenase family)
MLLKGKTALITGGNSGIGLATALRFVAERARVAITGRDAATLAGAANELGVTAIKSDVLDTQARSSLFDGSKMNSAISTSFLRMPGSRNSVL